MDLTDRCLTCFPHLPLTLRYLSAAKATWVRTAYALLAELLALEAIKHPEVFASKRDWWQREIARLVAGSPEHPLSHACREIADTASLTALAGALSALLAALDAPPAPAAGSVEQWWHTCDPRRYAQTLGEILIAAGPDETASFVETHAPWAERLMTAAFLAGQAESSTPPLDLQARYGFRRDDWIFTQFPPPLRRRVLSDWFTPPAVVIRRLTAALADQRNRRYAHFLWTVYLADRRRRRLCRTGRRQGMNRAPRNLTPADALALWRVVRRLPPA